MNLEGSLDAFGLPDVFALLASTGKSGALALRRPDVEGRLVEGVVWFRGGLLSGATSDRSRSSLVRRVVGSGAVDDAALRQAVARATGGGIGVARALLESGAVEPELLRQAATDQAVDAVFDLLRWPAGDFGFDQAGTDPDDVGITLEHGRVLAEARARSEAWQQLSALVPGPDSVLAVPVVLHHDPEVSRDEWALLALVDGRRRVRDLVDITGCGQFAVTTTLAHLVQRGLLHVKDAATPDHVAVVERRLAMLASIEAGSTEPAPHEDHAPAPGPVENDLAAGRVAGPGSLGMSAAAALVARRLEATQGGAPAPSQSARPAARREVVPPRPEPFLPGRRPDHPEPIEVTGTRPAPRVPARPAATAVSEPAYTGSVQSGEHVVEGATARAYAEPMAAAEHVVEGVIERDPGVNRSLLLRLIAGVRGL